MSATIRLMSCALVASSLAAFAQNPRVVVVPFAAGDGAPEASAATFQGLLVQQLSGRVDLVEPPQAAEADGSGGPDPRGLEAFEQGRRSFDARRFEDAVANHRRAIDALLADPERADFAVVREAWLQVAVASFRLGEERDTKQALLELCRLAPDYQLPKGFPPVFRRELEKARRRLDKRPRGQVVVEGPPGATAFLDGRGLGALPAVAAGVPAGSHQVRVDGPRGERFGSTLEVTGGVQKVRAFFVREAGLEVGAVLDEAVRERVAGHARAASASFALVGYVYRTSEAQLTAGTALYSVARGGFLPLVVVGFDPDVVTANPEAWRLADDVVKKLGDPGPPVSLPFSLATRAKSAVMARVEPARNLEPDLEALAAGAQDPARKLLLVPPAGAGAPPPAEAKPGVPAWVWVVAGVVAAGGLAAGGYFLVAGVTRPVTGSVTASW